MTKPLIKKHLQSRRSERKLVQEQASPWLRRGIPDLAYRTSALYSRFSLRDIGTLLPILPTGHRHEVYSPGGGSLDARLPVKYTNRPGGGSPWGRGKSCRIIRRILFGSIVYKVSNLSFDGVGH